MTGQAQTANVSTAAAFVSTYVCPANGQRILPSYIDCSKLILDVRPAASFATADLSDTFYQNPASMKFCPGSPGTIIVVRMAYAMPAILPFLGKNGVRITTGLVNDVPNDPGWNHLIVGTAVFQTEPFAANAYTAPAGC